MLIIDRGRIVAEGTPAELRAQAGGDADRARRVRRAAWRCARRSRSCRACPRWRSRSPRGRRGCASSACRARIRARTSSASPSRTAGSCASSPREALSLEDVFVRLTRHDEAAAAAGRAATAGEPRVRKLFAIVGREWRAYFLSPLAYVILTAFLFLNGIIFSRIVAFLSAPGAPHERFLSLMFTNTYFWIFTLFIVPIIDDAPARRGAAVAERSRCCSPRRSPRRRSWSGKFLGALGFFLMLWAPTRSSSCSCARRPGRPRRGLRPATSASRCSGAYFLAIGTFASTLTKNQIVAAILTFAMLIPIFSVGLFESGADPARQSLIGYLNIWDHMDEFARGVVDTRRHRLLPLGHGVLPLARGDDPLREEGDAVSARSARRVVRRRSGSSSAVALLVGRQLPRVAALEAGRLDGGRRSTRSPRRRRRSSTALKTPVQVTVFMTPRVAPLPAEVKELLSRYQARSPKIEVEYLDPERNPARAEALVQGVRDPRQNTVVFRSGDRQEVRRGGQARRLRLRAARAWAERPSVKAFKGEEAFTSAILDGHGGAAAEDRTSRRGTASRRSIPPSAAAASPRSSSCSSATT